MVSSKNFDPNESTKTFLGGFSTKCNSKHYLNHIGMCGVPKGSTTRITCELDI